MLTHLVLFLGSQRLELISRLHAAALDTAAAVFLIVRSGVALLALMQTTTQWRSEREN
jgi:hypothetical protein